MGECNCFVEKSMRTHTKMSTKLMSWRKNLDLFYAVVTFCIV